MILCITQDLKEVIMKLVINTVKKDDEIIFGRNSDFLTEIEKLYDSCYYKLEDCYSFI